MLIAPAHVDWQSEAEQLRRKLHVIYRFGLELSLRVCILPVGSHAFDQFVVSGALSERGSPSINVRLSTSQLQPHHKGHSRRECGRSRCHCDD